MTIQKQKIIALIPFANFFLFFWFAFRYPFKHSVKRKDWFLTAFLGLLSIVGVVILSDLLFALQITALDYVGFFFELYLAPLSFAWVFTLRRIKLEKEN